LHTPRSDAASEALAGRESRGGCVSSFNDYYIPSRGLRVTFIVDIQTDVLRPVHVRVERSIVLRTHVQPPRNTLPIVPPTTNTTRLRRVRLVQLFDTGSLDFRLVLENRGEAVERPPVQVEIAVPTPVFRLTVSVLTHAIQVTDVDLTDPFFDTSLDDVVGEGVEEVGTAFRPLVMESRGPVATTVVAFGDLLREVVPVLFQSGAGVEVGVLGTGRDGGEIRDAEVDASRLVAGRVRCFPLVGADEVEFPSLLRLVVDRTHLLDVLHLDVRSGFVFDEDVLPSAGVLLVIRTLADTV
jgi:hypothetical protein